MEVLQEVEELRHGNRRLQEANTQLQRQVDAQEEVAAGAQRETHDLQRRIRRYPDITTWP